MYTRFLLRWTGFVVRNAGLVLGTVFLITAVALYFTLNHFSINSDTEALIKQDAEWKKIHTDWANAFPHMIHTSLVVLTGESISVVDQVSKELESLLNANDEYFQSVFAPNNLEFINRHALLYIETDELDNLITRLAEAQPILTAFKVDPNLRGLFNLLKDALDSDEPLPDSFKQILEILSSAARDLNQGLVKPVAWRDRLFTGDTGDDADDKDSSRYYNIIFIKGKADFKDSLPNDQILSSIRGSIAKISHPQKDQVHIRLTGQIPLDHGEIVSATESAQLAGTIALLVLILVLVFGVRSLRVIVAIYISMLVGLIWTAAYALLSVGEFNTISIVFLVMFIGLGVDFAVHFCLRYQESLSSSSKIDAITFTSVDIGPAISLCAISSALGFLAFVPTSYTGLAELGIISGGGMIIALLVSLTLIPAFFSLVKEPLRLTPQPRVAAFSAILTTHRYKIIFLTVLMSLAAGLAAKDAYFDFSTLALKDQQSEAMETFLELQENKVITAFSISYVADSDQDARNIKEKLLALAVVSDVLIPEDYLPDDQNEKVAMLEEADLMLGSTFYAAPNPLPFDNQDRLALTATLIQSMDRSLATQNPQGQGPDIFSSLTELRNQLATLINAHNSANNNTSNNTKNAAAALELYESLVVSGVGEELKWLQQALQAAAIELKDVPPSMYSRLFSEDGRGLVSVIPEGDISSVEVLERFVNDVRSITGKATGRPVAELGIAEIVVEAFAEAIIYAVLAIAILLFIALKSIVDTCLVFIPLVLATVMTFAASVLTDLPINMANVVVVPLIFGLGVDNGIHVVKRFHQSHTLHDLITSSTPRAVLLSTLTTLGTFGALSFSSHHGIYSIGVLLTCALSFQLILTLVVLPALLSVFSSPRPQLVP